MKLTASLSVEEVKKLITGYVKKKTGKTVGNITIDETGYTVEIGIEDDESEE